MTQINKIFLSTCCTHTVRRCKRSLKQGFRVDEEILTFVQQVIQDFFYCYGDDEVEVHRRGNVKYSKSNNSRLLGEKRTCFDQFPINVGKEAN